jgi:hypothetical protein
MGETMDDNPYRPSELPTEKHEAGRWLGRAFGLTTLEWIALAGILAFLAYLRFVPGYTSNHEHRFKAKPLETRPGP